MLRVERQLLAEAPAVAQQAAMRLNLNIERALAILPKESRGLLEALPWYLMYGPNAQGGGKDNGLAYFQRDSPKHNSLLDEKWGSAFVVHCAPNYCQLSDFWALKSVLHELAHAYQLEQWPEKQLEILEAWQAAMDQGLHHGVQNDKGELLDRSYAATNQLEYFAELTCMYFVGCNYRPSNRRELNAYDPAGFAMIERMWGLDGSKAPVATRFVDQLAAVGSSESPESVDAAAPGDEKEKREQRAKPANMSKARELREWVDSTGKHKVAARLKSYGNGKVTIEKENGSAVTLPLDRFSKADQKYVEELLHLAP
ncbi:MAG: hypothetical protein H6821_03435 [Planctomycetaceae bacterium]|nr:hypothetical protein [Planctomycetales bacterium]MCB9873209.1 hypothetical protein [Planctomycetaceae bacterium]MCB9940729.1 hypothetical protein [Planctomycetaceae bacterium]